MSFTPYDRPVRAAFIGLGRIYDLNMRAYVDNPDVEVVALVDPSEERRAERAADWPEAQTFASAAELAASGLEVDAVEALLPIPLHDEGVVELLGYGWHVNLQKPMCNDLASAQRMVDAAAANDRLLRVMENYIFYEPLVQAEGDRATSGELGDVSGYHMKMVGSGRGGWDVPASSYEWQFQQMREGRGILVFDDGWHKLATALWLFGPVREVRAWMGGPRWFPASRSTRRRRSCGSTRTASAACGTSPWPPTCTCAPTTTPTTSAGRSPAARGYARVNRCTGRGIQQPSLEVYLDGEMRSYHALDDDWASSFRDSAAIGCAGCAPARARCCGAARRPSTSCGSRSPPTPAAPRAGRGGPGHRHVAGQPGAAKARGVGTMVSPVGTDSWSVRAGSEPRPADRGPRP